MIVPLAVNTAWLLASMPRACALRRALRDPEQAQRRLLERYLRRNANTAFGREHGFASIQTWEAYRRAVPVASYDAYASRIDRIRAGEPNVLTHERVERLVPSSGSTSAAKLIPYTARLRKEFARGVAAWISDLYLRRPLLRSGRAYWSISPIVPFETDLATKLAIGFEDDTAYVGGVLGPAIARALAVNPVMAQVQDIERFRYATALELLRARDLTLISVWHPSFLSLLLDSIAKHWDDLVRDVRSGRPSLELPDRVRSALTTRPDAHRADELAAIGCGAWREIWPALAFVSCWADGHASGAASVLARALPDVELQPKGLLATEAFVSLPFDGGWPVAILSHFLEFMDTEGCTHLVHQLEQDEEYSVVVTTGGGLYRYALRDRVRVEGFVERTPSLRFVGKPDRISDRFGEKLDDGFVASILRSTLDGRELRFAMLAPDERCDGTGYTLYVETSDARIGALAPTIESLLRRNPHYDYCRRLGQLDSLRIFQISGDAHAAYLIARSAAGQRLGDIKPAALDPRSNWSSIFPGSYVGEV